MAVVKSQPGVTTDQLIRQFNKKVQLEGILLELKDREFYRKPSQQRKMRKAETARKIKSGTRRSTGMK